MSGILNFILVAAGGFLGAIARNSVNIHLLSNSLSNISTTAVNLIGCFSLSYLLTEQNLKFKPSQKWIAFVGVGFLGSFTTFSSLILQTSLLFDSSLLSAILHLVSNILGGLIMAYFGYQLSLQLHRKESTDKCF